MNSLAHLDAAAGIIMTSASLVYLAAAMLLLRRWSSRRVPRAERLPPVTILKPLCGTEPLLYENLRTFCDQDYPEFQIIFGVRDKNDPAIGVARRLIDEFPALDLRLIIDDRIIGTNAKVSNLANMMSSVRHDTIVIADSDIYVGRDYLACLVGPLEDPAVGVVTCLYRARPHGLVSSYLQAMYVNEWFLPSVLVAKALGGSEFGFGSTLAVRAHVLKDIGGFHALADYLADDFMLGELARRQGLRTVLSPYLVETIAHEPGPAMLLAHELRWMRTIRTIQPWGYAGTWLTYAFPVSLCGAALVHSMPWSIGLPLLALALRIALHYVARQSLQLSYATNVWLVPVRDVLSFVVWLASFFSRRVTWRQQELSVDLIGRLQPDSEFKS